MAIQVNPKPLIVTLVIVEQAGRILLVQEAKENCRGKWSPPGGRMVATESVTDAAVREVKEESGIDVELSGLLYIDQLVDAPYEGNANRVRFVFVARPIGGQLKQEEDEHSMTANWFSASEIRALDTRSLFVERIIALYERGPSILPISSFHVMSAEDRKQERP